MIYLENDFIKVAFSLKGAELQELVNKRNGENYLWKGDANFWGKFSPVLFPIVGGLKNNSYTYKGENYQLGRHGFARDKDFSITEQSKDEIFFTFVDSPESYAVFPFKFRLGIRYKLNAANLECRYEVLNTDEENDLYFSIGGHPAFAIQTATGLNYDDYFLQFNHDDVLTYHEIENDLISNRTQSIQLMGGRLDLRHDLFYKDAMVFKTLKSDTISIRNTKNDHGLDFKFERFPYFGIWAAKDADFICLEPWCGVADVIGHNQELTTKEGIVKLAPEESFSRAWSVTLI